jgi:diaminopimelate decarboxylase
VILEPGRSLTARAGVTLYTVGSVKRSADSTVYLAVDGGMSDNPRPALYGARYTAVIADRACAPPAGVFTVVGKHCESGDLLIDAVPLPEPSRGDILAVPATGAYTLAMSSTYNAVPRPAAVLVAGGEARVIRRRETIDDLLAVESVDT